MALLGQEFCNQYRYVQVHFTAVSNFVAGELGTSGRNIYLNIGNG